MLVSCYHGANPALVRNPFSRHAWVGGGEPRWLANVDRLAACGFSTKEQGGKITYVGGVCAGTEREGLNRLAFCFVSGGAVWGGWARFLGRWGFV